MKALRAKYNQLSQAAESAEAAEEPLGLTLPEVGVSLLEIHAVAHTENDALPCLQHGWSDAVMRLLTTAGDLALMLVASESWVEWQAIVGRVLQRTPAEWRSAQEIEEDDEDIGLTGLRSCDRALVLCGMSL